MEFLIQHEMYPIKNGWAAQASTLRMAAHGHDEEAARDNLKQAVESFLIPFLREGTQRDEFNKIGLSVEWDKFGDAIEVTLV